MGGDLLIAHVAGQQLEAERGDEIRAARAEKSNALIGEAR
jgi:hypothetical protein